jgi:SAM-dependent methyltransferase
MEFFETSYGDRIALAPNVEKALYPLSNDESYVRRSLENSYISDRFLRKKKVNTNRISDITSDLNSYALVIDFLEELRLLSKDKVYDSALDIAGGAGIHAALFRAKYARHVEVADVSDGTDSALTRRLKAALWKHRLQKLEDRLSNGGFFNHRVKRVKNGKHLNIPSFKNYYGFNFKRKPTVDKFIVGDWRETVTKQYDLIMNFMSFWLWDHKIAMQKIAASLNPGGIFVTLAPYCWAGRGLGDGGYLLGGAFPFFEQRLTLDDTKRYYQQFKPNLADVVDEIYRCFDPHRPSLGDYIQCGFKNGLVIRGTKRIYNSDPKLALTHREFFGERLVVNPDCKTGAVADAGEVLKNIHRFRTDISFEDLLTRGIIMVFEKPPQRTPSNALA